MSSTRPPTRLALALLAATCLTPVAPAQAAPGDPIGPEFRVNTHTTYDQNFPAIAMDADGDFVITWKSHRQDGAGHGVFAQRFDAAGVAQGPEFRVSTSTSSSQVEPAVAMDADGDFIVVWVSADQDSSGIFAQRFDAAGVAQGPEFQVNSYTTNRQNAPDVAMDADGDFVVAWHSYRQDGAGDGVFAQRFDAVGVAQGPEFQVNTSTSSFQSYPTVAMDDDGDFVAAWRSSATGGRGIFARRFDAAGVAQGPEFKVDPSGSGSAQAVAMGADGDFVVIWEDYGLIGQIYNPAGEPRGGTFEISTYSSMVYMASVAMDADGDFVVVSEGSGAVREYDIYGRRFDAAGVAQGPAFKVNSSGTGSELVPAVAMDTDGGFVVAWHRRNGEYSDVFAQRFRGSEGVDSDFDGDGDADLLWRNAATGNAVVWLLDGQTRAEAGSIGAAPGDWRIAGTGDVNGDGMADILWRNTASGNTVVWQMNGLEKAAAQSIGAPPLTWTIEQIRDSDGDGKADILWRNIADGTTVIWQMDGFTRLDAGAVGRPSLEWWIVSTGDFNGDGKADVLWRNAVTGQTVIWLMDGMTRLAAGPVGAPGTAWRITGIGDFNGDGKADILLRHTEDGRVVMWQMNGLEIADYRVLAAVSPVWTVKHVRDTDGDGFADIVWRHGANGTIVFWRMNGFTKVSATMIGSANWDWQLR